MNRFRILALLSLIALPLCAAASDNLVRVEVLVFKYTTGQPDAWPVDRLEDFSALTDPRQRALMAAWTARYRDDIAMESEAADEDWPPADDEPGAAMPHDRPAAAPPAGLQAHGDGPLGPVWPELFVHEERLSGPMQRAFDRLNNSSGHQVLSTTTWLQPLDRRSAAPAVRVRDDTPVSVSWLTPPSTPFSVDRMLTAPNQLPPSIYRLDGSVRIRQRQFRHAELNLVWSERRPLQPLAAPASATEFEIHRMRLSRPIQLGRMEYFDSPWLGVLILVETWQPPTP